jgi:hypothetical protein
MHLRRRAVRSRLPIACGVVVSLLAVASAASYARAEPFEGPSFRKGLWRFERTVEFPLHRYVVRPEEMTRCVDPTNAMKDIFASPNVGSCRSTKPERVRNRYTFANRCDYLGPVRTDITVHSEEAYTELNVLKVGNFPKVDKVVAQRIGDCNVAE